MPKYDYTNSTIDRSDKKRLHFYEELYTILELHESVNEEVNELIGWLGVVLGYYTRLPKSISEKTLDNYLKPDKKIDDYTYIRNVSIQDIRLYSIISSRGFSSVAVRFSSTSFNSSLASFIVFSTNVNLSL